MPVTYGFIPARHRCDNGVVLTARRPGTCSIFMIVKGLTPENGAEVFAIMEFRSRFPRAAQGLSPGRLLIRGPPAARARSRAPAAHVSPVRGAHREPQGLVRRAPGRRAHDRHRSEPRLLARAAG